MHLMHLNDCIMIAVGDNREQERKKIKIEQLESFEGYCKNRYDP